MKTKWYDLAKQLMRAQGMSQDSLVDRMGITKGGLSHWLNGRREPNLEDIARIMRELGRRQFTVTHDGWSLMILFLIHFRPCRRVI